MNAADLVAATLPPSPPTDNNPWEFLLWVRTTVDVDRRHEHLDHWMGLVRQKSDLEQDALVQEGRACFGYRLQTVRDKLKDLNKQRRAREQYTATVVTDEFAAEQVFRLGEAVPNAFLKYTFAEPEQPPELVEEVVAGDTVYKPLRTKLIEGGTILLPADVEEFGTEYTLFCDIWTYLNTYVQLTDSAFSTLACCYVMMTWVHDVFDALPYLRAQGDLGVGKSRLIQTVGSVCYRPILAGGATTPSPVFRLIDRFRGTLIIDEADFGDSDLWTEIVKILNFGYQRGFSVLRTERAGDGEPFDVQAYNCFGPKILATRNRFKDAALESRCLSYTMPLQKDIDQRIPLALNDEFRQRAQRLRNQLLLWRFRNYTKVVVDPYLRVPGIREPRANQIIQPILACTQDERFRTTVLGEVRRYSARVQADRRDSIEGMVATACLTTWLQQRRPDRYTMKTVTEYLRSNFELKDISDRRVGDVLRNTLGVPTEQKGGYTYVKLTDALADEVALRYGLDSATAYGGLGEGAMPQVIPGQPPASPVDLINPNGDPAHAPSRG